MAQSIVLSGAKIKAYFGGTLLKELQSISYTVDWGETAIYGCDSAFPQEVCTTQVSVKGSGTIYYVQGNQGLAGKEIRSRVNEILHAPYISMRIKDRQFNEDIFFCPQIKVTSESMQITAKGTCKIQFNFIGIIPYMAADLV